MSTSPTSTVPTVELNDGHSIPQLGFGVFQIPPAETELPVSVALEAGYRHIDTAEMYGNEQGVGDAVRASGLDRADVFITSKLNNGFHEPDVARKAFDETLTALGSDYVDLFLIHWPLPTLYDGDFVSTWKVLEELRAGRPRALDRRLELPGCASRAPGGRDRGGAGREPDRASPVLPQRRGRRVRAGARDRDRGLGADRAGQGPGRSGTRRARGRARQVAGAGRPSLAHPARAHRLPQVRRRRHGSRRTSSCSTSSSSPTTSRAIDALDRGEAGRNGPNPDVFAYIPG